MLKFKLANLAVVAGLLLLALLTGPVSAAVPTVTTVNATGFDQTWAYVNGTISNNGTLAVPMVGFDYGLTNSYGSEVTTNGTYTTGSSFALPVTSLLPSATYYYRAKAYNVDGWGYGAAGTFNTLPDPTRYVSYTGAGTADSANVTYSTNWTYQTFTTGGTPHTVSAINLYLKRTSTPGDVTVSLRHTAGGVPTGSDITTGTLETTTVPTSTTWHQVTVTEVGLEANTVYAIVIRAPAGDVAKYISWRLTNPGLYGGGNAGRSGDGGTTWESEAPADYMFEILGNPCLRVIDAKVYQGYISTGDWLIVCYYHNIYPPYYDTYDVTHYFNLQLVDTDGTVKAQGACAAWGRKPGCIYQSASSVTALEWGRAYTVRVAYSGSSPYMEYPLQAADWVGTDLTALDSWVRSTAASIETYYGVDLLSYVIGKGEVLNTQGSAVFLAGIPGLAAQRPDLFATAVIVPPADTTPHTQSLQATLDWTVALGPDVTAAFTAMGNAVGMQGSAGGRAFGAILVFLLYLAVAIYGFAKGHVVASTFVTFPIILAGAYVGLLPVVIMAVLLAVSAFVLVWQFWLKGG